MVRKEFYLFYAKMILITHKEKPQVRVLSKNQSSSVISLV